MRRGLILSVFLVLAGCRHTGAYVWVDRYDGKPLAPSYVVGPGDTVTVKVLGHDEMSAHAKVRSDGRIAVPYLNDVEVANQTPDDVAEKLRKKLVDFVNRPIVTVTVDEPRPFTVPVTGEVTRPGVYPLDTPAGVLQALASAGGLTQFAHDDQIYVLRRGPDGVPVRIRFKYESLAHAEGASGTFALQRDDIVVVE
ncbi:MAG: polysaccharide biosynthesis/export family protein [Myxococcales bacterium]|nr:polysaccharide export protein [Myxococcales bacterium]